MIGRSAHDPYRLPFRLRATPVLATIAASATALLPIVTSWAMLPPFGLLMLLAWRLLRPELWPSWIGIPLGLADDILTGRPIGTGMALWTLTLLAIDQIDTRIMWRDHWHEWAIVAGALAFVIFGATALDWIVGAQGSLRASLPQYLAAVFAFPAVLRICAALDRWRLRR